MKSFEDLPTDRIVILPNNKNIILAADTAKNLSVKEVRVVPSRNIAQGLSALLRLDPEGNLDSVFDEMKEAITEVDCGEVTIATRTVEIDGVHVEEGKTIGLFNGKLVVAGDTTEGTVIDLLNKMNVNDREHVTIFYGNNISEELVNQIVENLQKMFSTIEFEVHDGGQPHYYMILSVE